MTYLNVYNLPYGFIHLTYQGNTCYVNTAHIQAAVERRQGVTSKCTAVIINNDDFMCNESISEVLIRISNSDKGA